MSTPEPLPGGADAKGDDLFGRRVLRKVAWRLIPFLCLLYILNSIDRGNVGFARLTMQADRNINDRIYDLGIGIFYFGYLAFEVPANFLLRWIGARRWIARIMISWGLVSCFTAAVQGPVSFYAVRILLGVAEAGFFPGIILYLTYWFPARERARVIALFMMAIPIASIVSNPTSGAIMQFLHGVGGLRGWQWVFLLEGLPSVVCGILVLFALPDGPVQARWLAPEERAWLTGRIEQEEKYRRERHGADFLRALVDWRVWLLIAVYFTVAVGMNAAGAYLAKLIKARFGTDDFHTGLLAALPYLCAMAGMVLLGSHSDRTGERRWHVAFAAAVAAAGWSLCTIAPSPWLFLVGLCLALAGMTSMLPPFWALPTAFLSGAAAAGGLALINSVANLGGLFGPNILGWLISPEFLGPYGFLGMALILLTGACLVLAARHDSTLEKGGPGTNAAAK